MPKSTKQKSSFLKSRRFQIQLYGALTVILFIVIGYYTFTNVMKLIDTRQQIDTHQRLHSALTQTNNRLDDEMTTVKEENAELFKKIQNELEYVFPKSENHTTLTREIEKFSNDLNRSRNPFLISSLQYLAQKQIQDKDYSSLPIKMTIHSSYDNFFKFLDWIDNSGVLSEKTRLLDIDSITINFVSPSGTQGNLSGQDEINFNISMNAYFR